MDVKTKSSTGLDSNIAAAISYFWLIGLVFFFIEKDSKFVRFHALQSIVLGVISIVVSFTFFLPLVIFVVMIFCAIKAYQGELYKLPVIGDFAEKQVNKETK